MARTTARKADARIHDLALTIEALRLSRGVSKRQLALKSGVDPSHLGKFLDGGKAGLSRSGLRFLVATDAILFVPERHKIIGQALERHERL